MNSSPDVASVPGTSQPIPARLPSVALDRLEHLVLAAADQQLHCVIRFHGHVDAEQLARAVRLTLDAEPVLGCRFVEHLWRPFWARLSGLDDLEHCPVEASAEPEAALERYILCPLDLAAGPQAQARLFRSDDDWLCIKLNHAVADGGGLIEYASLLASTYRRLAAEPAYRPAPNLNGERGQGQVFRRIPAPALFAALTRSGIPSPGWGFPASNSDRTGRRVLVRQVDAECVKALRSFARTRSVSFNDVLLAAFFRALWQVLAPPDDSAIAVQVPVNLRRYLPNGRAGAICNLAGSIYPAVRRQPDEPFEATLAAVHRAQAAAAGLLPGVGQALVLEAAMALPYALARRMAVSAMSGAHTGKSHPFLSNMGVIDPSWIDFGNASVSDAYGVGPLLYPPGFFLAASTFRGVLTLATSFCHTAMDAERMVRCVDQVIAELPTQQ